MDFLQEWRCGNSTLIWCLIWNHITVKENFGQTDFSRLSGFDRRSSRILSSIPQTFSRLIRPCEGLSLFLPDQRSVGMWPSIDPLALLFLPSSIYCCLALHCGYLWKDRPNAIFLHFFLSLCYFAIPSLQFSFDHMCKKSHICQFCTETARRECKSW